jgi:hypothetical protein
MVTSKINSLCGWSPKTCYEIKDNSFSKNPVNYKVSSIQLFFTVMYPHNAAKAMWLNIQFSDGLTSSKTKI